MFLKAEKIHDKENGYIGALKVPVRRLEITYPKSGNTVPDRQGMRRSSHPEEQNFSPGWGHQLAVNDYSFSAGSNPYTSFIER